MYPISGPAWSPHRVGRELPFFLRLSGPGVGSPSGPGPGTAGTTPAAGSNSPKAPKSGRTSIYVGVGVAVIVVMVILAWMLTNGFHPAGGSFSSSGYVLVPRGTSYSMVIGQFNGIDFHVNATSQIQGEVNSSRGIEVYILTPPEFAFLVKNLTVGQYVWSSGVVANQTVVNLNIPVEPGQWVLSFVNPNANFPTGVTFYSDLTLAAS